MSRAKWKGSFMDVLSLKVEKKDFKIWSRRSTIPYNLINNSVLVHNGKEFRKVFITREKVGFKFGEFAFTRKYGLRYKTVKGKKKK